MSDFIPPSLQSSPALLKANEELEARRLAITREEEKQKEIRKIEAQKYIERFYNERSTKIEESKKSYESVSKNNNQEEGEDIWKNVKNLVQFQKSPGLTRMESVFHSLEEANFVPRQSNRNFYHPTPKVIEKELKNKEPIIKKTHQESNNIDREKLVHKSKVIQEIKEEPISQSKIIPEEIPKSDAVKESFFMVEEPTTNSDVISIINQKEATTNITNVIPESNVIDQISVSTVIPETREELQSNVIQEPIHQSSVCEELNAKPDIIQEKLEEPVNNLPDEIPESSTATLIQETNQEFNFESNFSNDSPKDNSFDFFSSKETANNNESDQNFGSFSSDSNFDVPFEFSSNSDSFQSASNDKSFDFFSSQESANAGLDTDQNFGNFSSSNNFEASFESPSAISFEPAFNASFESGFSSNFQANFDSSSNFNSSSETSFDTNFDNSFNASFSDDKSFDKDDFDRDDDEEYFTPKKKSSWWNDDDDDDYDSKKEKKSKKIDFIDIILNDNEDSSKILIQQVTENNIDLLTKISDSNDAKEIVQKLIANKIVDNNGRSLLHLACANGSFRWVDLLLQFGHKEEVDQNGNTPLHDAVQTQNGFRIASLLISKPYLFNLNPRNEKQRTPLHEACIRSNAKCVQLLSANKADKVAQDIEGQTPLHLACLSSSLSTVEALFKDGEFDVKIKDNTGRTPLHAAAHSCSWQICKALMNRGLSVTDMDNNGLDALLWALSQEKKLIDTQEDSCLECIESFLRFSSVDIKDSKLRTPLHYAAFANLPKCVQFLLSHNANVNTLDQNGQSPLFSAVSSPVLDLQCYDVVVLLLNAGADPNIVSKSNARTVTHLAAIAAKEKTLLEILSKCDNTTLSTLDAYHKSVVHYASENNLYKSAIKILQQAPELLQCKDLKNRNLLHYICKGGALDIYNWLYKNHIDQLKSWAFEKDSSDILPFHLACLEGNVDIIQSIASLVGDKKADIINTRDKSGNLPIHYAATGGKEWAIDALLNDLNSPVNVENNEKMTPLHLTAKSDSPQIVGLFTVAGIPVDCKDAKGRTPLHLAIMRKNFPIACELFRKGANINEKDNNNMSPLDIASKLNLEERIKELLTASEDLYF